MDRVFGVSVALVRRAGTALAAAGVGLLLAGCATYSCGGPASGHCYGTVSWGVRDLEEPDFRAFGTVVRPVQLNRGNLVITNELWVTQQARPGEPAPCAGNSSCWVEVGFSSGACAGTADTRYFWAENHPNQAFVCHDLGPVLPHEFDQPALFVINRPFNRERTFVVTVEPCTVIDGGTVPCPSRALTAESTNNPMAANVVTIGMELAGTSGASAPTTVFTQNIHRVIGSPIGLGYVTVSGSVQVQRPPIAADWAAPPSEQTQGGSFSTSCCQ